MTSRLSGSIRFEILVVLFLLIGLQSCISHKEMVTLNGNESLPNNFKTDKLVHVSQPQKFEVYKVQSFDQLMIKVNAFEGSTEQFLNQEFAPENNNNSNQNFDPASMYFNTYNVDEKGYVDLPVVKKIKVDGLTLSQIKDKLDEAYKPFLKFAYTKVKMANNRVTVMGEVNNPGVYYLYNDQNTILDAISLAGDFTDFGNRAKVKLLRQSKEGVESVYINMSRSEFIYSPYYYIQPYDVIYIEPTKRKPRNVEAEAVSVILTAVSVAVLLLNLFINK